MPEIVDLVGKIRAQTERAILIMPNDADEAAWLPLSQIEIHPADKPGEVCVSLPEWLAVEKNLV